MNFCGDCSEILLFPIEWKYGLCVECLAIHFEKAEEVEYIEFDDE